MEPAINRITIGEQTQKLQPKLIKLLCYLAERPLEMLTREQLLKEVWEREFVNDEVLSRSIALLRQALGDDARRPVFIETIPRKGYRLLLQPVTGDVHRQSTERHNRFKWLIGLAIVLLILPLAYMWLVKPEPQPDNPIERIIDPAQLASRFTSQPGVERGGDISADGKQALYAKLSGQGTGIYIGSLEGGAHQLLIGGVEYKDSPVFSPDQSQIAYQLRAAEGCSIMLWDFATRQQDALGSCWNGSSSALDWSKDGRWLAFSYAAPVGAGIALLEVASREITVLTYPENPEHADTGPRFSPDGRYLSFARGNRITSELYSLELDTTHSARQLTYDGQLVNGHDWVSDNRLIYASDKQAFQALWLLQVDSMEVSYLGARRARRPMYSIAANRLLYEDWQYQANIWSVSMDQDSQPQPLIVSTRYDNQPVFSPDGSRLAFGSNRTGSDSLWLANADGSMARLAYSVAGARVSRPAWSPDGGRLIVSVYDEQGSQLHELNSEGEFIQVITWAGENASNAVYHPDGQRLLFIHESPETSQLWQAGLDEDNRTSSWVGAILANRVQVSRAGEVLFTRPAVDGIFSVQLDNFQQKLIVPGFQAAGWYHWLVVNDSIVYANPEGVWKVAVAGGQPGLVSQFIPTAIGTTMAMSDDEQVLLVTRTDAAEIDLMLSRLSAEENR